MKPLCLPARASRRDNDPWVEASEAFVKAAKDEYNGLQHLHCDGVNGLIMQTYKSRYGRSVGELK
jgi:hypothetical protein